MTPKEFKELYPKFAHLEGDQLWNKMEEVMLQNAKPATKEDIDKFFEVPENNGKIPLESYRMIFIDMSTKESFEAKDLKDEHGKRQS